MCAEQRKHPTTCDPDYTDDEAEFLRAVDAFKRRRGTRFPTYTEILGIAVSLGYRKGDAPPPSAPPPPKAQRGPTDEERSRVLELLRSGMSQRAVASVLGLSECKVARISLEAGFQSPRVKRHSELYRERVLSLRDSGKTRFEIAETVGCHPSTVWRILDANKHREADG